ncbi:MAG: hypothetical protein KDC66_14160 [Phaeodactylibacter sp.]|nr:hypothetical protein [Phaeodactylibacter sp.]MCB9275534.1 hypothetical protein [Lewinellaceae bacterium]
MKNRTKSMLPLITSCLFWALVIAMAGSCQSSKTYSPAGLVLLPPETLLDMARSKTLFPLEATVKDSLGNVMGERVMEEILKANLGASFYANEAGKVEEVVVRPPSLEDELLLLQLVETDNFLKREVPFMEINCARKKEILEYISKRDQGGRGVPVDVGLGGNIDENNQIILANLFRQCGFPATEDVGEPAMLGAFLVLQHAPSDMRGYYFSFIEAEVKSGMLSKDLLALMTDRLLAIDHDKKQVYGTQVLNVGGNITVLPVRDEEHLEQRRAEVGLKPLYERLRRFE